MAFREDESGAQAPKGKVTPPSGAVTAVSASRGGGGKTPPPPDPPDEDEGDDGMLRMSFLDHLTELRSRIIKMAAGVLVAFFLSMFYCQRLWLLVAAPAFEALTRLGVKPPTLKPLHPWSNSMSYG